MLKRKMTLWLLCLVVGLLVLTGCESRAGEGETAANAGDTAILVDLPAIVIDFDADGNATLGGAPVAELNPGLAALNEAIGPDTIGLFMENGIQHIQISTTPTGLTILVNGQAIPSLGWDADSLAGSQTLLAALGIDGLEMVQGLLPVIADVGIGVTLQFPVGDAEAIPLMVGGEGSAAETAAAAQQAFLAQAGTPARINIPITYADDGSFNIGSLTAEEITLLVGAPIESLTLSAEDVASYKGMGIQTIVLATDSEGVRMSLNGNALPHISWGDGKLAYGLQLALQTGLLGGDGEGGDMSAVIEKLMPIIQTAEVNVQVTFPE